MSSVKKILKRNDTIRNTYHKIHEIFFTLLVKASPILASKYIYQKATDKKLNLNNPKDFNEKLQWLKLYWQHHLVVKCADKYEVRNYVIESGCGEILNELYGVYNDTSEISWDSLPKKFALKTTNGSATNIICNDKSILDKDEAINKLEKWLNIDFGLLYAEIHYSKMTPRIICEKYIETDAGVLPNDYKIFCFNGEPKFLYVGIIDETGYTHKTFYDMEWNKQNFLKESYKSYDHEKPSCLNEMIKYASILAKPFPFVRVDFYDSNGKPLFGEMTFTPTGGLATYYKDETLELLGNLIELPEKI
ncbi:ATP-grasp fold amidoligase family protein [Sporosarcina sp. FSL K6-1540]|uniref:ATP-grasp fold amidoligase family protein n=1 Tax=Sporosarcina sp. FSL K6-1540 TaxID=2921555 RepID=UPI00315A3673